MPLICACVRRVLQWNLLAATLMAWMMQLPKDVLYLFSRDIYMYVFINIYQYIYIFIYIYIIYLYLFIDWYPWNTGQCLFVEKIGQFLIFVVHVCSHLPCFLRCKEAINPVKIWRFWGPNHCWAALSTGCWHIAHRYRTRAEHSIDQGERKMRIHMFLLIWITNACIYRY